MNRHDDTAALDLIQISQIEQGTWNPREIIDSLSQVDPANRHDTHWFGFGKSGGLPSVHREQFWLKYWAPLAKENLSITASGVAPTILSFPMDTNYAGSNVSEVETTESTFRELAKQWKKETKHLSSITEMAMKLSYQEIIGMGEKALPLILRELQKEVDHWFWALRVISRENPVAPQNAGNVEAMAEDWLRWGATKGYI